LQEAAKGKKQRYPILMVLDEFYALGRLQFVAKAAERDHAARRVLGRHQIVSGADNPARAR
jgi:hypothetical protein